MTDHITHLVQPAPAEAASDHVMHVAPKRQAPRIDPPAVMLGWLIPLAVTVAIVGAALWAVFG